MTDDLRLLIVAETLRRGEVVVADSMGVSHTVRSTPDFGKLRLWVDGVRDGWLGVEWESDGPLFVAGKKPNVIEFKGSAAARIREAFDIREEL